MKSATVTALPQRGESRARILKAALDIIAAEGLDNLTHRGVAEAADVSLGTTTYHFDSRDTLIREAFESYMDEYEASLASLLTDIRITTVDMLVGFLISTTALADEQRNLARTEHQMVLAAHRDGALKARVNLWRRSLETWLIDPLEYLGFDKPLQTARILISICRGTEFEAMCSAIPVSADALEARLKVILERPA